jgi:uncharacterized RDD family membrane protein YckC
MSDATPTPAPRCLRCGVEMSPDAPAGLCPACLMAVAAEPVSDLSVAMTTLSPPGGSRTPARAGPGAAARLAPGQEFGPYRIVRLLGRGGMGEVYEAEQREQGRRVALKVLSQRLTDPHDRARFLREGQLAASINHPHSVYIFGSDEIGGTPVIAMELLAGGTLKDRVREQGPLPPAEAVEAILQIVAGLDAAQAGGILHRDIKPANCFIDRDGTVKIGDFGLSISTMARDVTQLTQSGTFRGTPQFAAPEQLKGEPLDVRADMYAVGATLYYLLTGQSPFDDADLMALLTRIATEVPRSPRALQPRVPRGLATIVLRCLAKDPASRPATYAVLEEALRPFGSGAPTPATIGLRFVAGTIDRTIWIPLNVFLTPWILTVLHSAAAFAWLGSIQIAMTIAYYGILEGLWGASIGKWITGLRVTKANGQPVGMASALWRAVVFQTPSVVAALPTLFLGQRRVLETGVQTPWVAIATVWGIWVLLFSTARRRNGFAGVHDLASQTRVVRRLERDARSALDAPRDPTPATSTAAHRYGPYEVVRTLGSTDVGELLIGFDQSLCRHVWIHRLLPGTAAVAPLIRDLSRPARLRWLSGRRSTNEAWDAYEALDGVPLISLLGAPRTWRAVRPWLLDLAREIDAGLKDGSVRSLTIDHVWITRDGYAKLLDFRAPGVPLAGNQEERVTLESGQTFLGSVARGALDGSSGCRVAGDHRTCSRSAAALCIGDARDAGAPRVHHLVGDGHPDGRSAARPRPRGARPPRCALLRSRARNHAADELGSPASQCRAAHDDERESAERRPDPSVEPHAGSQRRARTGAGRPRGVYRGSISIDDDYRSIHVYELVYWPHS